jgi:GAF domain-containing protein
LTEELVEPIPETRELLDLLWAGADEQPLEGWLLTKAQQVSATLPACVGLSISLIGELGLTFTFIATPDDVRLIDGAQYLNGGPCEDAAYQGVRVDSELVNERHWQLAALAASWTGVRSSLSLPIRTRGGAFGSVNFYGASTNCFTGRAEDLAVMFGAAAEEAILNDDLSMSGLERARRSTSRIVDENAVEAATAVLADSSGVTQDEARQRLFDAAARAGVPASSLAKLLLDDDAR